MDSTEVEISGNILQDFIDTVLGAFPSVLSPSSWKSERISQGKLVKNPKPYRSPQAISGWKKSNKKRAYHHMSISEEFFANWGIDVHAEEKKKRQILKNLDELSKSLKVSPVFDVYAVEGDAVGFTGDGLQIAFSPMKTQLEKEYLVKEPKRLYSGVKLSNLKKVLRKDPNYFNH